MKLIIYGNSDFAELISYYFSTDSDYDIAGYCVDRDFVKSDFFLSKPLVAYDEVDKRFPPNEYMMFVAVGYKNMRLRKILYEKTKAKGYSHANYISSKASLDTSNTIGENNAILHQAVLEPFAKIGNNNIINTNVILCHHSEVANHCFIGAKSSIGGYTAIGDNSFLGFGSTLLQKLTIASETLIGAQSLLTRSTEPYTMYIGIPAKAVRTHQKDGIQIVD